MATNAIFYCGLAPLLTGVLFMSVGVPYNILLSYQCVEVCLCLHVLNLKSTIFVLILVGS